MVPSGVCSAYMSAAGAVMMPDECLWAERLKMQSLCFVIVLATGIRLSRTCEQPTSIHVPFISHDRNLSPSCLMGMYHLHTTDSSQSEGDALTCALAGHLANLAVSCLVASGERNSTNKKGINTFCSHVSVPQPSLKLCQT